MNLIESPAIRRLVVNTMVSQKRWIDLPDLREEHAQMWALSADPRGLKHWYVVGTLTLEEYEALLDIKFGLVPVENE